MVIDMGYWTKVSKRILVLVLTLIGIYLAFKLAVFYMPFLIAFIISLLIEPLIKFVNKKTSLTRKTSAIILGELSGKVCPAVGTIAMHIGKGGFDVKVRSSVKPICEKCKIIKRKGSIRVICENPKHKQRQG